MPVVQQQLNCMIKLGVYFWPDPTHDENINEPKLQNRILKIYSMLKGIGVVKGFKIGCGKRLAVTRNVDRTQSLTISSFKSAMPLQVVSHQHFSKFQILPYFQHFFWNQGLRIRSSNRESESCMKKNEKVSMRMLCMKNSC